MMIEIERLRLREYQKTRNIARKRNSINIEESQAKYLIPWLILKL